MRPALITAMALMFVSSAALAQDRARLQDFASKLGVSKWNLISCVRGAGGRPGQDADDEKRKAFARALYDCVSGKNPQLTREQFRSALLEMRK